MVVLAAAVALVAMLARPGASEPVLVPRTLADARPVTAGPVVPGFPIDFLAVVWRGPGDGHDRAAVRFRHGRDWTGWQPLEEDGAQEPGQFGSSLVGGADADAYQVRGVPPGAAQPKAVAINTTDGPLIETGRQPSGGAQAAVPCRSRADWGADESLMTWTPEYSGVQVLTVHHTDTLNGDGDPAATVRAIQRYHAVERGWGDIGYQYLIDQAGVVYEGRYSGSSRSCLTAGGDGSDFGHDGAGQGVTAAHVGGMNSGNLGVALLGTYTSVLPPAAQRSALEAELAELAGRHGIDPERLDVAYVNPVSGATRTVAAISGHRDWLATECPGGALYAQLPSIRTNVKARLAPTPTTTTTTTATTTTTTPAIQLAARLYRLKGVPQADLTWSGATTATVDVRRNGAVVAAATPNDGFHTDRLAKGVTSATYRLCESGTSRCSADVAVSF